jgi:hypothetical protein
VVTEQGNATVRTVEAGSPEELALAVSELMEQTYLYEPTQGMREKATAPPWFLMGVTIGLAGGMYGHSGESLMGGVAMQARFRFSERVYGGLFIEGKLGPRQGEPDGIISGWRMAPGVFLTYLFRFSRVGFGPLLELSAMYTTLNALLGSSDYTTQRWWSFRGGGGVELDVQLSDMISVFLDFTVGGITHAGKIVRRSSGSEVLTGPFLDYSVNIGVIYGVL